MSDPPRLNFGASKATGTNTPSFFGTSGATGGFSGFGNSAANNISGSTPSGFAGFGASNAQNTTGTAAASTPSFGWAAPPTSTSATSASASASTPSIFGSTTPAAPKTGGFSFGSTTPAGDPPAATTLDASTGVTVTSQPGAASGSLSGGGKNLFGQQSAMSVAGQTAPAAKSLFSGQTQSTGQSSNLFGGPGQDNGQSSNLFGGLGQAKSDAKPAAAITSTAPAFSFTNTQATASALSTSNLFAPSTGATPTAGQSGQKSLFSFPPNGATPGPAISKTAEISTQNKPQFSFPPASSSAESAPKPAASPFSGFGLGGAQAPSSSSAAATTSAPAFSFPSTSTATSQSASSAPAFPSFTTPAASTSTSQPATTAPLFPSFTVGGASTSASQPASTSTTAPATTVTSQPSASAGLTASTAGPAPPSQSRLKNKTMDEILTRWATDLTKYTKDFRSTAETVATWDQHLVDNMSKISKIYSATLTAERQTDSVEMQLTAVENQQAELESWLNVYEKQVDEMLERENKGGQGEVGGPDSERERTYRMSEKLGDRLEEMGTDLEGMVAEINAANSVLSRGGKVDEPITQIVRILNSHLTQLKTIDDGAAALNAKVEKAQKSIGSLGYSNGGMNGNGTTAVDDFYKSYLGRRG